MALDDGRGGQKRDDDVLGLVDERAAHLLRLPQHEPLDRDLEQPRLDALPLPAFLLLAVVELDLLHAVDELYDVALVGSRLLEAHVVQLAAALHEEQDPADIERTAQQEDAENRRVVAAHHGSVDDERHDGHRHAQQRTREERLDAVVVADTLHDVAHHLRIEEDDRKAHELGQEIRNERNADPGGHVQHQPRADEVVGRLAQHQHHLRDEHHHHEREIARADALVHDRLREERQDQAQHAGREHRQRKLCKVVFVGPQVLQQITRFQPLVFVAFLAVEGRCGLQKQGDAISGCSRRRSC